MLKGQRTVYHVIGSSRVIVPTSVAFAWPDTALSLWWDDCAAKLEMQVNECLHVGVALRRGMALTAHSEA